MILLKTFRLLHTPPFLLVLSFSPTHIHRQYETDCFVLYQAMTKEREEVALEADFLQMDVQRLTNLLHSKAGIS